MWVGEGMDAMGSLTRDDLEALFTKSRVGFWKLEICEGASPRLYADDTMCELIGVPADAAPEECYVALHAGIHPDERELFKDYVTGLVIGGSEIIYRFVHPIEGVMTVRCSGTRMDSAPGMISLVGCHQPLTGISRLESGKLSEIDLSKANHHLVHERTLVEGYYKELLDIAGCGILSYTLPGHQVILMNAEARRMYGVEDVPDMQSHLAEIFSRVDYPDANAVEQLKALRSKDGSHDYRFSIRNARGQLVEAIARTQIVVTPEGERAIVTTFADISENVVLREGMEQARRAGAAKMDFLRRMSHDIRTPINGILGMIEIAEHSDGDFAKIEECHRKAREASGYLLDLVNSILDMSKLESGNVTLGHEPFDLLETIDEVGNITRMNAEENAISVAVDSSGVAHRHLLGSPLHLRQVLLNITGNAVKYTRPNGSIELACREVAAEGGSALFEIVCSDNGYGMSEEFRAHAFDPFAQESERVCNTEKGTGLGLPIVKQLVELMGGSIELESKEDVGTTFAIRLPFEVDADFAEQVRDLDLDNGLSVEGLRVLVVDDNDLNREIATFMLERSGIVVSEADNGAEAVERFAASEPGEFGLVLMDVMMPVLDGLEATRAIRALDRPDACSVPIIAMTANAFRDDVARSIEAGMNAHLSKPIDKHELIAAIANWAGRARIAAGACGGCR